MEAEYLKYVEFSNTCLLTVEYLRYVEFSNASGLLAFRIEPADPEPADPGAWDILIVGKRGAVLALDTGENVENSRIRYQVSNSSFNTLQANSYRAGGFFFVS